MNANEQYIERRKIIDKEIGILMQKLEAMDIEQKKDLKDYGFAGNCGHILEVLNELNYGFLKKY